MEFVNYDNKSSRKNVSNINESYYNRRRTHLKESAVPANRDDIDRNKLDGTAMVLNDCLNKFYSFADGKKIEFEVDDNGRPVIDATYNLLNQNDPYLITLQLQNHHTGYDYLISIDFPKELGLEFDDVFADREDCYDYEILYDRNDGEGTLWFYTSYPLTTITDAFDIIVRNVPNCNIQSNLKSVSNANESYHDRRRKKLLKESFSHPDAETVKNVLAVLGIVPVDVKGGMMWLSQENEKYYWSASEALSELDLSYVDDEYTFMTD